MAQMNETPSGERTHIAFFGKRNAGKSSLMNAFTGQQIAIVSDYKGTTTDPVQKAMELLPLGPVLVIDTPGLDDIGELGAKRIEAAERILRKTDIALLIADNTGTDEDLRELLNLASVRGIPYIIVHNKSDLLDAVPAETEHEIWVSALTGANITRLKEKTAAMYKPFDPTITYFKSRPGAIAAGETLRFTVIFPRDFQVSYCWLAVNEDGCETRFLPMTWGSACRGTEACRDGQPGVRRC